MRGDTLIQRHPPTPPTFVGDFHSDLHRVAQYNADRGYPYDEASYGVPGVVGHEGIPSRASHVGSHNGEGVGLGIQYVSTWYPNTDNDADQIQGRLRCSGVLSRWLGRWSSGMWNLVVCVPQCLTCSRAVKVSSRRRPQDRQSKMTTQHDRRAVLDRRRPLVLLGGMTAPKQSQHRKPERQKQLKARRQRHLS